MKGSQSGHALSVTLMAVVFLAALSVIDWKTISGTRLKNFSLFDDLIATDDKVEESDNLVTVDPELAAAIEEVTSEAEMPVRNVEGNDGTDNPAPVSSEKTYAETPEKVNGIQPIEDYSPDGGMASQLRNSLNESSGRIVRAAVIGDSYIEGDIFTQDVRRLLQSKYGGRGVGYMAMHSDFPGFRRSIVQSDEGWTVKDIRHSAHDNIKPLSGTYCIASSGAKTTFRKAGNASATPWSVSRLLFFSDRSGGITVTTDAGTETHQVEASDNLQYIETTGETAKYVFKTDIDSLKVLGTWLDDPTGVSVDCMSMRGNSGASHRYISRPLAASMAASVDYDLIVIEFGTNVISSAQTDYSSYGIVMGRVIDRLRECYPNAAIIMLGVGDRGEKIGTEVKSMPVVAAMTGAQRDCAKKKGIMFWDMRAAMGGNNSIVDWRKRGLVNSDYIHLNHKGGSVLAEEFVKSLEMCINAE